MIQEISKTIKLLFQTLGLGTKVVVEEVKPYAKLYTKGLLWLSMIAVLSPIPFLIIGITLDLRWLIALTGIWWALWTFLLLLMALPIGILIESLTGGIKGSGQRYIKLVTGILIVGLCISLFTSIIPVKANLAMLPLLIVAAIILGLLNAWLFSRKVITPLVSIIFIALLLSFFFPSTFETLGLKISDVDISIAEPERLHITYDDIEKQRIKFFHPDGRPKVWYYRPEDGRFELFDKKGHHPIYREKLKPVTPEVISQIEKQLKLDIERRSQEEQRKLEETKRLEKQAEIAEKEKRLNEFKALINRGITTHPSKPNVAIIIESRRTEGGLSPENTLYNFLKKQQRANVISNLFMEEPFKAKGFFREIYEGNTEILKQADALSRINYLIIGRLDYSFQKRAEIEKDLVSCDINFSYKIINKKSEVVKSESIRVVGPGFSNDSALERGLEILSEQYSDRILKQLL